MIVRRGLGTGRRVQAPEPPSAWRRWQLRARRAARLPPHSNEVGFRFQAWATASSQAMISSGWVGCCPVSARRFRMRCIDSLMFNQEPPKGVYNGMIPCWISQSTKLGVLWPLRLSQTNSTRSGGKSSGNGGGWSSPAHQHFYNARLISGSRSSAGVGRSSRMALSSCCNQGCKTVFGQLVTPLTRTCPSEG
jgi:hypothetical protein